PLPRCVDAVVGYFRAPNGGIPKQRLAAQRDSPRGDRARINAWMGPLRWPDGSRHRHEDVRRLGAAQGTTKKVWIRARSGRHGRKTTTEKEITFPIRGRAGVKFVCPASP